MENVQTYTAQFEHITFWQKLKSMLNVDFKRMFTTKLVYIMAAVCLLIPIAMLVMINMAGGSADPSSAEGMGTFTNVWQAIGSLSGSAMGMDLTTMCNINMVYFLAVILVCLFVTEDFKSGYAKNLFTVRAKKVDYVISKTIVCFVGCAIMLFAYFIGSLIGGGIAGLPFTMEGFNVGNLIACLLSKIFMMALFVGIFVCFSTIAKQRTWMAVVGGLAVSMLLFNMIPMIAPLNANILNVILCLIGGGAFATGIGAFSCLVLNKTSLV
jgi:ABC-type transport system involved in multi-copper enzyme maturation permease subunit